MLAFFKFTQFSSFYELFMVHFVTKSWGTFLLQLPSSATDSELEERIIQHLAAAAAMGRTRHLARREGPRGRSSAQGRPQFLVFSTHPNAPPLAGASSSTQRSGGEPTPEDLVSGQDSAIVSGQPVTQPSSFQADQVPASGSGSNAAVNQPGTSLINRYVCVSNLIRVLMISFFCLAPYELQCYTYIL